MRDKMLTYGVFMGKRFSPKQKERFLAYLVHDLTEMGYEAKALKGEGRNKSTMNLIVGDLVKANTVYTTYYDTPAKLFWSNIDYYPLNGSLSVKKSSVATYLPPILFLLLSTLPIMYVFLNPTLGGDFHMYILVAVAAISMFVSSYFSRGVANKVNFNRNTSGVLTLLDIASKIPESKRKNVAFIFCDKGTSNNAGAKMLEQLLPKSLANHLFIVVDCVGVGDNIGIGYRENNKKEAKELASLYKGTKDVMTVEMDEKRRIYTSTFFLPKCLLVCTGRKEEKDIVVSNTSSKRDYDWDPENISEISDLLVKYAK